MRDCVDKGRLRPQNGGKASARIKPEERHKIHALYKSGRLQREIAADYGVSQVCISQILRGKRVDHEAH
jgi:DNA-directed RNA polymerase specialized sigma subunit